MYIYNTSFHISDSVKHDFLAWLRSDYIPQAVASGLFTNQQLNRILTEISPDTTSYALQFTTPDLDRASDWDETAGAMLKQQMFRRFGEHALSFVTFMEIIDNG